MAMADGSVFDSAHKGDFNHVKINVEKDSTWFTKLDSVRLTFEVTYFDKEADLWLIEFFPAIFAASPRHIALC